MYNFHYNVWMKHFPQSTLLFMGTDRLAYATPTKNMQETLLKLKDYFDFSNLDKNNPLYSIHNMSKTGKFKDELAGKTFKGFAGLKPKLYAILYEEPCGKDSETKIAKGIKRCTKNKELSFNSYKHTIETTMDVSVSMNYIISQKHEIYSMSRRKIALSINDTKRFILQDGIHTLAHGHYKTKKN